MKNKIKKIMKSPLTICGIVSFIVGILVGTLLAIRLGRSQSNTNTRINA